MNVNFFGAVNIIKTFLPHLLDNSEGHIVTVSSMGGFFPFPGQTIYGASKAALKLLSEGLIIELANTNVNVTLALPGAMATDIAKNSGVKFSEDMEKMQATSKALSPKKAAKIIVNAMEKNRKRVFVGSDSKMMSVLYSIFPGFAPKVMGKIMQSKISLED